MHRLDRYRRTYMIQGDDDGYMLPLDVGVFGKDLCIVMIDFVTKV
jgi:hypothetical protein